MLPFRRSVGSSIKKVFIINSLCCLKAFPYLFSKQKLLKQKILETCQVFSFDRLYLITFRAKNTQKLTLLTYFTIIERKQAKWTKSIGFLVVCLKKFSEWFSIRTILTQADQVTHATLEFLGTFIVTSTRTKNQSVRVRNTINSLDTLEGNKLLWEFELL